MDPLHVPFEICALIAGYSSAESLLGLQYLSSSFRSACTNEAKKRLRKKQNSGLAPIKALYCQEYKKCIKCGISTSSGLTSDPRLCLCCEPNDESRQILRTDARNFFGISDQDLRPLPVHTKPSNYRRGDVMSLFNLKDVKEAAYRSYGGKAGWYKMAREQEAKSAKLKLSRQRNQEQRTRQLEGLLRDDGVDESGMARARQCSEFKKFVSNGAQKTQEALATLVAQIRYRPSYGSLSRRQSSFHSYGYGRSYRSFW
jgi:hypothetical protein